MKRESSGGLSAAALLVYFALFFTYWVLAPIVLGVEVPDDNREQIAWATHPALGYSKHPPLPTLVYWLASRMFPASVSLTYLLGAAVVGVMIACAWGISRALFDEKRAWLTALMCTFISYYTLRMHFYNHNTMLLCWTAVAYLSLVRAWQRNHWSDWALLGVCWGAGMLSKYQMLIGIACNIAGIFILMPTRVSRVRAVAIAGATALALFAPHGYWLVANDFPPLRYAMEFVGAGLSPSARLHRVLSFTADQLLRIAPLLVLLGLMALLNWRRQSSWELDASASCSPAVRRLLMVHAMGPIVLIGAVGLIGGVDLEMHWGTAYLWAIPLWLLSLARFRRLALWPTAQWLHVVVVLQVMMMIAFALRETAGR